ncbi:MAG: AraC family transcriptional regulator [Spirochaetes bacterium]|nr:AraC family transcriptional regulator [Spirochaetota bacterium]
MDISYITYPTIFLSFLMAVGLLLRPWRFRNVVLAVFIAELGYLTLFIYMLQTKLIFSYPDYFLLLIPIEISMGPLLYLYVLSFIKNKQKFHYHDIVNFIPLMVVVIIILPFAFASDETKRDLVKILLMQEDVKFIQILISAAAAVVLPICYISLSIWQIWFRKPSENMAYQPLILLITLLIIWLFLGVVGIAGSMTFSEKLLMLDNIIISLIIISFYLISSRYPYLMQFGTIPPKKKQYAKSYLDKVNTKSINRQLKIIMEEEKLFCDEDLSLGRLSEALELTKNQLSQFLNTYHKKNFNNFVNGYRIEEAKKMIKEQPHRQIIAIAFAVGFNSYSAFHSMFKKMTGITPADYRRKNEQDLL